MKRPEPINEEIELENNVYIESDTDLKGIITYVNDYFAEISRYTREELVGQPHSIVRHPDMPKAAFEQMWKTIQSSNIWEGYVKNLRKDGKFYWVIVNIVPKLDENGEITGYIASRKVPQRHDIQSIEQDYKQMLTAEL